VDMIVYRVWKRSGFSSASECCGVLLPKKNFDDLLSLVCVAWHS
jgi:hypothetical protein